MPTSSTPTSSIADFYNNQLIDNIVRPVQASDIDGLIGKNIMKANASSGFLTLTLNGTLGDLGFLYKPVKFALRSEIATQSTEINPDERSLNTERRGLVQHRRHQVEG